jgi:hypothetical protein
VSGGGGAAFATGHGAGLAGGEAGGLAEPEDFLGGEGSELAGLEAAELDGANGHAAEAHDLVAELGQHAADLAVLAFGEDHFEDGGLALLAGDADLAGAGLAFSQPDALGEVAEGSVVGGAGDEGAIELFDAVSGVGEAVGELAVVGQEDEAGAGLVEASDGVDALGDLGQEIDDAWSAAGVVVGGDVALGLIDGVVDGDFEFDGDAIDGDFGLERIDLGAELLDGFAVDGDAALFDEFFAGAT